MASDFVRGLQEAVDILLKTQDINDLAKHLGRSAKWVYNFIEKRTDGVRVSEDLEAGLLHYGFALQVVRTDPTDISQETFEEEWENACKRLNPRAWRDR